VAGSRGGGSGWRGGSALEGGDEQLADFDCGRSGGSALECGDEQLADVDCDENEQSDEFDLRLLGRTPPDSERVLKSSARLSSAA
jgi:hypothetical protein